METLFGEIKRLGGAPTISKRRGTINGKTREYRLVRFNDAGVAATIIIDDEAFSKNRFRNELNRDAGLLFLKTLDDETRAGNYDVYLTYGGYWAAKDAAKIMKNRAGKNAFYLLNLAYRDKRLFQLFDLIITPSPFAREHYLKTLSIQSTSIPPLIDRTACLAPERQARYLTLINPSPEKGGRFALGVFLDLQKIRNDVPILIAEGRGDFHALVASTPEARNLKNVRLLKGTVDAKKIYAKTRLLLAPSLCAETFGRISVEAAFNGIPALVSDRGALPDVMGNDEYVLPIPERFSPLSVELPNPGETQPWIEAILKRWYGCYRKEDEMLCSNISQRFDSKKVLALLEQTLREKTFH